MFLDLFKKIPCRDHIQNRGNVRLNLKTRGCRLNTRLSLPFPSKTSFCVIHWLFVSGLTSLAAWRRIGTRTMQRYHALEALRLTRSRAILSTAAQRSNLSRSRNNVASQELQPCPSFPSEADSLHSHPTNSSGSDTSSSSFSEQSSIQSDEDDTSLGTCGLSSCLENAFHITD